MVCLSPFGGNKPYRQVSIRDMECAKCTGGGNAECDVQNARVKNEMSNATQYEKLLVQDARINVSYRMQQRMEDRMHEMIQCGSLI